MKILMIMRLQLHEIPKHNKKQKVRKTSRLNNDMKWKFFYLQFFNTAIQTILIRKSGKMKYYDILFPKYESSVIHVLYIDITE